MARARRIGHHAVVIEGGAEFVPTPLENDRWLESGALLGLEVLADGGDRVGYLSDVYVNRDTLAVEAYELRTPWWERWLGRPRLIMPDQVLASSHELMIIPDQRRAGQESETNWDEVTLTVPMGRRATADGAAEMEAKSA
jgi:sporulation protein YlmC with PRC-barrel domain